MANVADVAQRLIRAQETGIPIPPVRGEIKGVDEAYAVQRETLRHWTRVGGKVAGRKIGLTSKAVQAQLGVDEPDFGVLLEDMIRSDSAKIELGVVLQPRVEAEIAFVLGRDLAGEKISAEQVLMATEYVCPALEICGSRIAHWDIKIEDTIADNASAGLVVIGGRRSPRPSLDALASTGMSLKRDGTEVAQGRGEACLGNPALAVAWLAEALTRFGERLQAGDLVMSGALAKMITANPGDIFEARFGNFGSVSARFES